MEPAEKTRAIASNDNDIGQKRNKLFKGVIGRINEAIEKGYYLEAITLEESLICDRFASRFTYLYEKRNLSVKDLKKFKNAEELVESNFYKIMLGQIYSNIDDIEEDNDIKEFCEKELKPWTILRNESLHEMAKLSEGSNKTFSEKYSKLESIAETGRKIFRKAEKLINKTKK